MLSIDFTLVIFTASFIIFAFLLKALFFDKLAKVTDARDSYVENLANEAQKITEDIESKLENLDPNKILKEARTQSQKIIQSSLDLANKSKSEMLEAKNTELKAFVGKELQQLESEKNHALASFDACVSELTDSIVEKLANKEAAYAQRA